MVLAPVPPMAGCRSRGASALVRGWPSRPRSTALLDQIRTPRLLLIESELAVAMPKFRWAKPSPRLASRPRRHLRRRAVVASRLGLGFFTELLWDWLARDCAVETKQPATCGAHLCPLQVQFPRRQQAATPLPAAPAPRSTVASHLELGIR